MPFVTTPPRFACPAGSPGFSHQRGFAETAGAGSGHLGIPPMLQRFLARKSRENLDTLTGEVGHALSAVTLGFVSPRTEKKMY